MEQETTIEIILTGAGMLPGRVRSRELGEFIDAVEDMVASMVIHDHPELSKEIFVVGLKNIRKGSISLSFAINLPELTLPATRQVATTIRNGEIGSLPYSVMSSLAKVAAFTCRHECYAEFFEHNGSTISLAIVGPDTEIPKVDLIQGETTLYGEITRVGGADPKIQFRTIEGQTVYCETDKKVAKQAGLRLYTQVGLHGVASWNSQTFKIEEFHTTEIADYEDSPLTEAFADLKDLIEDSITNLDNPIKAVHELRYGSR